jgi:hypothetical protein
MPFDPDAYLATPFDPDKYLSKFDPDKYLGSKAEIPGTPPQPVPRKDVKYGPGGDSVRAQILDAGNILDSQLQAGREIGGGLLSYFGGAAKSLFGADVPNLEKNIDQVGKVVVKPSSNPESEPYTRKANELFNNLNALAPGIGWIGAVGKRVPKGGKPLETPRVEPKLDADAIIKEHKAQTEAANTPHPPIPAEAQMELPDGAMIQAPQYGVMQGMSRLDENGMPIRADLSMDAQNMQNPLQRNLWGDELPRQSPQEAPRPLTQAMDKMAPEARTAAIEQTKLGREMESPQLETAMGDAARPFDPMAMELPRAPTDGGGAPAMDLSGGMGGRQRGGVLIDFKPREEKIPVGEATELDHMPRANLELVARDLTGTAKDLEVFETLTQPEQAKVIEISKYLSGGPGGRQRGAMLIPGSKPKPKDSITAPTSPETIAKKQELANKAAALKLQGTQYERVQTLEEVKAAPGKDISQNFGRDEVSSGIGGMVNRNSDNKLLKYARTLYTSARQAAEAFSSKYVTGDNGVNKAYRALAQSEWVAVADALMAGSRNKTKLTPELMAKLGLNEKQMDMVNKVYAALDKMYEMANDALMSQGFEPFKYHEGYVPSMFDGSYTSLIRKDGVIKGVVQGDTKYQRAAGEKWFKDKGDYEIIQLPRRGLNTTAGHSRVFSGWNDLIAEIAKHNPEFGALKAEVDHHIAQSTKRLYEFDVHEKKKTGVTGSKGDKPWLDQKQNSREFLEGLINYMEEGSRYYSYQDAVNKVGAMTTDPALVTKFPNSINYLNKYTKHITGHDLNGLGAVLNTGLDLLPKLFGVGPEIPKKLVNGVRTAMTAHMMGIFNLGFAGVQMTQLMTGGMPEAMAIAKATGLHPGEVAGAWAKSSAQLSSIVAERITGKKFSHVEQYMRDALTWAEEQGMLYFSEAELSREVLQSEGVTRLKKAAMAPISYPEMATRPPVFMWYVELFNKAGLSGDLLYTTAKEATDYGMVNYHPDERPMVYSQLGYAGQFLGALTTFKHNLLDQTTTRVVKGTKQPAALATGAAMGAFFYGFSGLPGYQEADKVFQAITGQSVREFLLEKMGDASEKGKEAFSYLMDGVVSAYTGLDIQARMSMASVVPFDDDLGSSLASPQLANFFDILAKGYTYAKDRDVASRNEFARAVTPLGMRGFVEDQLMTKDVDQVPWAPGTGHVLDKKGRHKYEDPRSDEERKIRAATGIRPIRERIEDEDLYSDRKTEKNKQEKQKVQQDRLTAAINFGDQAAVQDAIAKFLAEGGDPQSITNARIKQIVVDAAKSARQREIMAPKNNIGSVNKYKNYHD